METPNKICKIVILDGVLSRDDGMEFPSEGTYIRADETLTDLWLWDGPFPEPVQE
jgi:hypothetical protein